MEGVERFGGAGAAASARFVDYVSSVEYNDALMCISSEWRDRTIMDHELTPSFGPPDFEDKLDKMHRMLVIRGMRPDRTMIVAKEFVGEALGERCARVVNTPGSFNIAPAVFSERHRRLGSAAPFSAAYWQSQLDIGTARPDTD